VSKEGFVNIHGNEYKTVAARVADFHKNRSDTMRINTELIYHDDKRVIMKALIYDSDVIIATGYAEETRSQNTMNKTSAMEVGETSAIGRALACLGMGGSDSYASADEVLRAVEQQEESGEEFLLGTDQENQEQGTSDIPDDILDIVKENFIMLKKREDDAVIWHKRVLGNFFGTKVKEDESAVDAIKELGREQLAELAELQTDKLKLNGED
jgi:hypothetical protein